MLVFLIKYYGQYPMEKSSNFSIHAVNQKILCEMHVIGISHTLLLYFYYKFLIANALILFCLKVRFPCRIKTWNSVGFSLLPISNDK